MEETSWINDWLALVIGVGVFIIAAGFWLWRNKVNPRPRVEHHRPD